MLYFSLIVAVIKQKMFIQESLVEKTFRMKAGELVEIGHLRRRGKHTRQL